MIYKHSDLLLQCSHFNREIDVEKNLFYLDIISV